MLTSEERKSSRVAISLMSEHLRRTAIADHLVSPAFEMMNVFLRQMRCRDRGEVRRSQSVSESWSQ